MLEKVSFLKRTSSQSKNVITLKQSSPLLVFRTFILMVLVSLVAGCGSGSSSTSLQPIEDAIWIGIQGGENGSWEEFISVSSPEELNDLGTQYAETSGVTFRWEDEVISISSSGGDEKYGIIIVSASASNQKVFSIVLQTTISELSRMELPVNENENGTLQVDVEEPAGFASSFVRLFLEDENKRVYSSEFPSRETFSVKPETYDLIVTRSDSYSDTPTHLEARRDLLLSAGTTLTETVSNAAFDATNALSGPYTIQTLNNDSSTMDRSLYWGGVSLQTFNGTETELSAYIDDGDADISYAVLGSLLDVTDVYCLELSIEPDATSDISYFEGFRSEENKTVTPPSEPFTGSFVSNLTNGSLLPGLIGTTYADAIGYTIGYEGTANSGTESEADYTFNFHISEERAAEVTSGTDISITSPDFSSVSGWKSRWSIPETVVMGSTAASVQVGSSGITLQDFINWYIKDSPWLDDGEWFASIAEIQSGEGSNSGAF